MRQLKQLKQLQIMQAVAGNEAIAANTEADLAESEAGAAADLALQEANNEKLMQKL